MLCSRCTFVSGGNKGLVSHAILSINAQWGDGGKFGKCQQYNGSSRTMLTNLDFSTILLNEFNISFWMYNKDTSNNTAIIGNKDLYIVKTSSNILRIWINGIGNCDATNITIPNQKWIHISISKTTSHIYTYLNGILKNTFSINNSSITTSSGTNTFTIGINDSSSYNGFNGYINDLIIYNNAISTKEIQNISQGLFIYYPLSCPGNPNLASTFWGNSGVQFTKKNNVVSFVSNATYGGIYIPASVFTVGKTYTLSYSYQKTSGTLNTIGGYCGAVTVSSFTIDGVTYNDYNSENVTNDNYSHFVVLTFVYNGGTSNNNLYIQPNRYSTTSIGIKLTNIKLEEGDRHTPWCPNVNDDCYESLGFNDDIEFDCSGFEVNGKIYGIFEKTSDTKRNSGSYIFDGTTNRIMTNLAEISDNIFSENIFSVSCWCKSTLSSSSYKYICALNNTGGASDCKFGIAIKGSNFYFILNGTENSSSTCTLNTWYHICITYDGSIFRCYINGSEVKTLSNTTSMIKSNLCIGAKATSVTTADSFFKGNISDFRLYTTCLSSDVVKSLYDTPISISNNSTLFTQGEFIEY